MYIFAAAAACDNSGRPAKIIGCERISDLGKQNSAGLVLLFAITTNWFCNLLILSAAALAFARTHTHTRTANFTVFIWRISPCSLPLSLRVRLAKQAESAFCARELIAAIIRAGAPRKLAVHAANDNNLPSDSLHPSVVDSQIFPVPRGNMELDLFLRVLPIPLYFIRAAPFFAFVLFRALKNFVHYCVPRYGRRVKVWLDLFNCLL